MGLDHPAPRRLLRPPRPPGSPGGPRHAPALPILPIAVKYRCVRDPRPAIHAGLAALEHALAITPGRGDTLYYRLRRVGEKVLGRIEKEFGAATPQTASLNERILSLKERVLDRVARDVGVTRPAELSFAEQMRFLFNAVQEFANEFADATDEYGCRQHARRLETVRPLLTDLRRVHNFLVVTDSYVAEQMTGERFLDVLGRLEREVWGRVHHGVPREAVVRIAPPVQLEAYYANYRQSRRPAITAVTTQLEETVRSLLVELSTIGTPLPD